MATLILTGILNGEVALLRRYHTGSKSMLELKSLSVALAIYLEVHQATVVLVSSVFK
jgi:hypothetical protein